MLTSQIATFSVTDDLQGLLCWNSADMHYSCEVNGGSQVGPSLSVQIHALKRLSRILGLARRAGSVNAILDKCLTLSKLGVTGLCKESKEYPRQSMQGLLPRDFEDEEHLILRAVGGAFWSLLSKDCIHQDRWRRPRAASMHRGSPEAQQTHHMEEDSQPEEQYTCARRKVSSSVVLASVADVGSHIGYPQ